MVSREAAKVSKVKPPVPVPAKYNPFNVEAGQVWEDLDIRNRNGAGEFRRIKIHSFAESENGHSALVENIATGKRSFVKLASFRSAGKRGFKLITGASGFPA